MIATNLLALALMAALNPLVARAPEPRGLTPENCQVSDAPPMPRTVIAAADLPDEPVMPLPPAKSTTRALPASTSSAHVAELKRALAANDRPAFDAALARAKADGVATRVYEDVARIWDAQFESPFFAEDSDAYRVASSYPGYAEAVRRQVFTDASGRKYYPAAESRAFVATHAGVRSPTSRRITTTTTETEPAPTTSRPPTSTPTPSPATTSRATTSRATTSRATTSRTTTRRSTPATSGKTASSKPAASRKKAPPSSPDPSAPPKIAARGPAPVVASPVADSSPTDAPPAAGMSDTVAPSTPDAGPVATDTDTALTDTTATAAVTETDTTAPVTTTTATAEPAKTRPILIPAILILIGLGVLILLFRTRA